MRTRCPKKTIVSAKDDDYRNDCKNTACWKRRNDSTNICSLLHVDNSSSEEDSEEELVSSRYHQNCSPRNYNGKKKANCSTRRKQSPTTNYQSQKLSPVMCKDYCKMNNIHGEGESTNFYKRSSFPRDSTTCCNKKTSSDKNACFRKEKSMCCQNLSSDEKLLCCDDLSPRRTTDFCKSSEDNFCNESNSNKATLPGDSSDFCNQKPFRRESADSRKFTSRTNCESKTKLECCRPLNSSDCCLNETRFNKPERKICRNLNSRDSDSDENPRILLFSQSEPPHKICRRGCVSCYCNKAPVKPLLKCNNEAEHCACRRNSEENAFRKNCKSPFRSLCDNPEAHSVFLKYSPESRRRVFEKFTKRRRNYENYSAGYFLELKKQLAKLEEEMGRSGSDCCVCEKSPSCRNYCRDSPEDRRRSAEGNVNGSSSVDHCKMMQENNRYGKTSEEDICRNCLGERKRSINNFCEDHKFQERKYSNSTNDHRKQSDKNECNDSFDGHSNIIDDEGILRKNKTCRNSSSKLDITKDLIEFRDKNYFQCHSYTSLNQPITETHRCQHDYTINNQFQPVPKNPDAYGVSRCKICSKPSLETLLSYCNSNCSFNSLRLPSRSRISASESVEVICEDEGSSSKSGAKMLVYNFGDECYNIEVSQDFYRDLENSLRVPVYKKPAPANSMALRFQKGIC